MSATADGILDAALALYLERGIGATSLSSVAHRAGVSRPTVYKHLGDGAAIARAVVDREVVRFLDALQASIAEGQEANGVVAGGAVAGGSVAAVTEADDRVVDIAVLAVRHARAHPLLRRLLELEPATVLPALTVDADRLMRRAVEVVAGLLTSVSGRDAADVAAADADADADTAAVGLSGDNEVARIRAEVVVRLVLSLVVTPSVVADLDDEPALRRYLDVALRGVVD